MISCASVTLTSRVGVQTPKQLLNVIDVIWKYPLPSEPGGRQVGTHRGGWVVVRPRPPRRRRRRRLCHLRRLHHLPEAAGLWRHHGHVWQGDDLKLTSYSNSDKHGCTRKIYSEDPKMVKQIFSTCICPEENKDEVKSSANQLYRVNSINLILDSEVSL